MITPSGKVKVTDFGIVSIQDEESDITKTGSILGTASYISPEQAQGKSVTVGSDLYSLGTVLYELQEILLLKLIHQLQQQQNT